MEPSPIEWTHRIHRGAALPIITVYENLATLSFILQNMAAAWMSKYQVLHAVKYFVRIINMM